MKTNTEELNAFLAWAEEFAAKNRLEMKGFVTYDNDWFSNTYLYELLKDEVIVLNKELGEEVKVKISEEAVKDPKMRQGVEEIYSEYASAPWYYKNEGNLFNSPLLRERFKVKDEDVILKKFKKTFEILNGQDHIVFADWYGVYFLRLAVLTGTTFCEKTFKTEELYGLREFLLKEKPAGCVLSAVSSDPECPISAFCLGPVMNLFVYPELQYFKLLFVSKTQTDKPAMDWVLAYVK
jgi:hypothetical protein